MIYGYARVSTDSQSVTAQAAALTDAGAGEVFREVTSGAKTDRAQLRKVLAALDAGDVLMLTVLGGLAAGESPRTIGRSYGIHRSTTERLAA